MKKLSLYILAGVALLVASCDDMLDFYPEYTYNDSNSWKTASDIEQEANNYYTWMPYIQARSDIEGIGDRDFAADLMYPDGNTISNSTYTQNSSEKKYDNYYKHLRSINYLFRNVETYYEGNIDDVQQYIAEAYFFRAYESWIFFRDFGPGTIVKDVLETDNAEVTAPRDSRNDFVDWMIEDLETALASSALPTQRDIRGSATDGRITTGAANALLAHICLFEGTWQKYHSEMDDYPAENNPTTSASREERAKYLLEKAKTACEAVINEGSYELFYSDALGAASYKYMFTLESTRSNNPAGILKSENHEYIFRNRFNNENKVFNANVTHAYRTVAVTRWFIEQFETLSGEEINTKGNTFNCWCDDNVDPRLAEVAIPHMSYYWHYASERSDYTSLAGSNINNKADFYYYINKWSTEINVDVNSCAYDVPVFRLGGLYLDYAETLCELNNGTLSVGENEHINLLRKRAHMPVKSSWSLEDIRRERACELYLEGYRLDDIRRWAKGPEYLGRNIEGLWIGQASERSDDNLNVVSTVAPSEIVFEVNGTTYDTRNFEWVRLDSGDKFCWCLCDPNNVPTYAEAFTNRKIYGASKANCSKRDVTSTLSKADTGGLVSTDGYYIYETAANRKFNKWNYMLPLPNDQMTLNSNLVQNPWW